MLKLFRIFTGTITGIATIVLLLQLVLENSANFRRNIGVSLLVALSASIATEFVTSATTKRKTTADLVIETIKDPKLPQAQREIVIDSLVRSLAAKEVTHIKEHLQERNARILKDPSSSVHEVLRILEQQI